MLAGESNGVDIITHPDGYSGTGGTVTVGLCVDSSSAHADDMDISLRNVAKEFTERTAYTNNLSAGNDNNIPALPTTYDFESVALHEVGHCLGLAHTNLASESGLPSSQYDYTKTTDGVNDTYNVDAGLDTIIGSEDDGRGDDVNLHWFEKGVNNPFTLPVIVDSSTYSRDVSDLPINHSVVRNGNRDVSSFLGYGDSEAVMNQGTINDEAQRYLAADDVAMLEMAASGINRTSGDSDDYALIVEYLGVVSDPENAPDCDIVIRFDSIKTSFSVCSITASTLSSNHYAITSGNIYFNDEVNWFFNDIYRAPNPTCNLINLTIDDVQSFTGCTDLTVGTNVTITTTGQATFSATNSIVLSSGFSITSGGQATFSITH